jgi:cbb3-type cytochrome oxidase maturation protein
MRHGWRGSMMKALEPRLRGDDEHMDILFLLIPLSVALGLVILGALGWAVWRGQFESVDAEGERILRSD